MTKNLQCFYLKKLLVENCVNVFVFLYLILKLLSFCNSIVHKKCKYRGKFLYIIHSNKENEKYNADESPREEAREEDGWSAVRRKIRIT
jgi:hypothetical protein